MSYALGNLGELYALQKKFVPAETLLRQALGISQRAFGPDNIDVARVSCRLAIVLTAQKKYAEANTLFLSSLPIQERVLGARSPDLVEALEEFASLLRKMENSSQAEIVEARAKNIRFDMTYTVPASRLGK
jgi:tetratricopeptide (TPR) repeat protein